MSEQGIVLTLDGGYIGQQVTPAALSTNHLIFPSQNLIYNTLAQLEVFQGCLPRKTNIGGPLSFLDGNSWATTDNGSVVQYVGKSIWFNGGAGNVTVPDPTAVDPTAPGTAIHVIGVSSSILQIAVIDPGTGNTYLAAVQAGLQPPPAPTLAARTTLGIGFTGKNTGNYSVVITKIRSTTGAESQPSSPSNVVNATAQSLRLAFPAAPTDGTDKYRIYVTGAGFGATGPYLLLMEITEAAVAASTTDSIARAIEIEWNDSTLDPVRPPINNFPPPAGLFVAAIANVMNVIGTFGGLGLSPAIPGQPEAYRPDFASFLPEPVNCVAGRPQDGFIYIGCPNSVSAAVYTGAAQSGPVTIRPVWDRIGCAGPTGMCVVGQQLYMVTPVGKIVRTDSGGQVDENFSAMIDSDLTGTDPTKTVLIYDERRQVVLVCNQRLVLCFHVILGLWSPPLKLNQVTGSGQPSGNVVSGFTLHGKAYFVTLEAGNYNMYGFDDGATGVAACIVTTGWRSSGIATVLTPAVPDKLTTITDISTVYQSPGTTTVSGSIFKNLITSAPAGTLTQAWNSASGLAKWRRCNIKDCRLFAVSLAWTGIVGQKLFAVEVERTTSAIHSR